MARDSGAYLCWIDQEMCCGEPVLPLNLILQSQQSILGSSTAHRILFALHDTKSRRHMAETLINTVYSRSDAMCRGHISHADGWDDMGPRIMDYKI